jgi:hypothetical protein
MGRETLKPCRLRLDLQTTAEPQPEVIHTMRGNCTGTCKARTSGSQRNLFTIPGRTRKNKRRVSTQQLGCANHLDYQIIKGYQK